MMEVLAGNHYPERNPDVVTITTAVGETVLESPYHPALPASAKAIGGKFRPTDKTWIFDARDEQRVRDLARNIYGTDGSDGDKPTVTVRIPLSTEMEETRSATIYLGGHEVAHRPGRDAPVRIGRGVVVVEGRFPSRAGSVKNPQLGADGVTVEIRDLPQGTADRILSAWTGATIVGGDQERIAALQSERAALVARLAEIDAILSAR